MGEYIKKTLHKKISYFDVNIYDYALSQRYKGLLDAISHSKIKVNHHEVDFNMDTSTNKIKEVFPNEMSTFYVGATDNISYGIIKGLNDMSADYPEKISVSGFGDYPTSQILNPSLTTVHFDYDLIGSRALEILLNLIDNNLNKDEKTTMLDCKIFIRDSTKKHLEN